MTKAKRNTLLLLSIFIALVLLTTMSLPTLVLRSGQPFSLAQSQLLPLGGSTLLPPGGLVLVVIRGIIALALISLPFLLIYELRTPAGRRRLLMYAVIFALLFIAADYLRTHNPPAQQPEQTTALDSTQDPLTDNALAPSVFSPTPPAGLTAAVALLTALMLVGLLVAAIWFVRRRKTAPPTPLERLAQEVQSAIDSLQTGGDLKMTIVRCYQEMNRVVQEEKGVARQVTMTPREFEDQLIKIGLPSESIKTLTALFERVRYGNALADAQEESLALACLTNIVNACRSGALAYEA